MAVNAINQGKAISFVKQVLNSGKNLHGVKPKVKINFDEVDKFLYVTPPLKNPATGNIVATFPSDLPPLKEGWIRLIHRTIPEYTTPILNSGLRGKYGIRGTTTAHDTEDFWQNLANEGLMIYGPKKVVMDMPDREYRKLFLKGKYYKKGSKNDEKNYFSARELYVKNKYIVGIIDVYGSHKPLTPQQLESMQRSAQLNPFLDIKPEDLRQLNPGRPTKRALLERKALKEIAAASQEAPTVQYEHPSIEEFFDF